jgi:hypothetical protein
MKEWLPLVAVVLGSLIATSPLPYPNGCVGGPKGQSKSEPSSATLKSTSKMQ